MIRLILGLSYLTGLRIFCTISCHFGSLSFVIQCSGLSLLRAGFGSARVVYIDYLGLRGEFNQWLKNNTDVYEELSEQSHLKMFYKT